MIPVRVIGLLCLVVISVSMLTGSLVFAQMLLDTAPVVKVHSTTVVTKDIRPGTFIEIEQDLEYLRDCGAHIDRFLFDCCSGRKMLEPVSYIHPPEGLGRFKIKFSEYVPINFKPGPARYDATPAYWCNPVQRWWTPITRPGNKSTTLPFEIVK